MKRQTLWLCTNDALSEAGSIQSLTQVSIASLAVNLVVEEAKVLVGAGTLQPDNISVLQTHLCAKENSLSTRVTCRGNPTSATS